MKQKRPKPEEIIRLLRECDGSGLSQGLESRIIEPDFGSEGGGVNCHERLGEMLRYYHRDAA